MVNPEPNIPRKLRWWFWLMLVAPAVVSVAVTALSSLVASGEQELGWMISANFLVALPLNGICSACCAVHLSRVKTGGTHAAWLVLGTLGFFALNTALAFGGCAAGAFALDALNL